MMRRYPLRQFSLLLLALLLSACDTVAYYGQAASGQLAILMQRQDIDRLLEDPELSDERRRAFEVVQEARAFARDELAMEIDGSYRSFVELDREHVLWNVFAAPAFSLEPETWCFPLVGCLAYRGYFSEGRARRYAERLEARGLDVYVGGVDAYSTLGWFNDPLLSSLADRPPHQLFALVVHELAHQQVFVRGDTTFNESYASFLEQEGLRRWLAGRDEPVLYQRHQEEAQRRADFVALVTAYRERFARLYESELDEAAMAREKRRLQEAMREAHAGLVLQWGVPAYQGWFDGPLNNAQLITVSAYHDRVPAFARLFVESGEDWARFHEAVRELAGLEPEARATALERLAGERLTDAARAPAPTPSAPRSR